jgi:hypothetical protein
MTPTPFPPGSLAERAWLTDWAHEVADPVLAAYGLREGNREVVYAPGDGTRYVTVIAEHRGRRWLIFPNLGHCVLPLDRMFGVHDFCRMQHVPVGGWRALRPLLAALGYADGPFVMNDYDHLREAEARTKARSDGEPLNVDDEILGRAVRRLVTKQERTGQPPPAETEQS